MDNIRPVSFDEFIGNKKIIEQSKYLVTIAAIKGEPLSHIMLGGPPGTGKTTLARIIAKEMHEQYLDKTLLPWKYKGEPISLIEMVDSDSSFNHFKESRMIETSGNAIKDNSKIVDLIEELTDQNETVHLKKDRSPDITGDEGDYELCLPKILYVDEIHSLKPRVQDDLLLLLEQFVLGVSSKHPTYKQGRYDVKPFTLIASTTDPGRLAPALLSRFGTTLMFEDYSFEDLVGIAKVSIKKMDPEATITQNAAEEIAKRSKGVARIITQHCKKTYDRMLMDWVLKKSNKKSITKRHTEDVFDLFDINSEGLQVASDIKVLQVLALNYPKPVGSRSLSEMATMDRPYIEKIIEPNLIKLGLIQRLPRGRVLTEKGISYLKERELLPDALINEELESFLPLKKG